MGLTVSTSFRWLSSACCGVHMYAAGPTTSGSLPRLSVELLATQGPPGAPPNLLATVTGRDVVVTWDASDPNGAVVTKYTVKLQTSAGVDIPGTAVDITDLTQPFSKSYSGLDAGSYKASVAAFNGLAGDPGVAAFAIEAVSWVGLALLGVQ